MFSSESELKLSGSDVDGRISAFSRSELALTGGSSAQTVELTNSADATLKAMAGVQTLTCDDSSDAFCFDPTKVGSSSIRGKGETPEELKAHFGQLVIDVERLWGGGQEEEALEAVRAELRPFLENPVYAEQVPFALAGYSQRLLNEGLSNAAEAFATLASEVGRDRLGDGYQYTMLATRALGHIKVERGKTLEGEKVFRELHAESRRVLGEVHPKTLIAVRRLAELHAVHGRFDEADAAHRELLETVRAELDERNTTRLDVLWSYGRFLTGRQRYAEAETLMLQAWSAEASGENRERRGKAIADLVALYEAWGKPDRVAEWRSRIDEADG